MNAPIVTVFGAGVAGLTAAHELVERGFVVQVIEAQEDLYCPGRPAVGGMAANQPARVRAGIEELHPDVLELARSTEAKLASGARVARWLLKMFALNRSRWLSTERPERLQQALFTDPTDADQATFQASFVDSLKNARAAYRRQWIWDLVVRGVLLKTVRYKEEGLESAAQQQALRVYERLVADDDTAALATTLHAIQVASSKAQKDAPTGPELKKHMQALVIPAIEREFLCFRLSAHALPSFENARKDAQKLFKAWTAFLQKAFKHNFVERTSRHGQIPVEQANPPPGLPPDPLCWVELQVIEQRLPGEHGYRFFPSFYRHLDDTLKRIPLFIGDVPTGRSVYDNLVPTIFQGIGLSAEDRKKIAARGATVFDEPDSRRGAPAREASGSTVVELHRDRPRSIVGFRNRTDRFVERIGGTKRDAVLLLAKLLRFLTSSQERRRQFYENVSWKDFLYANVSFSEVMKEHIQSAAQALLAFSASEADARTYGNVALQMLLDQLSDGTRVDRTLNGPTSDAWLEPWREYLERHGVRFFRRKLTALDFDAERGLVPVLEAEQGLARGQVREPLQSQEGYALLTHEQSEDRDGLAPDFYVLALSLEETVRLLEPFQHDPHSARDFWSLLEFWKDVDGRKALKTMTGAQFFFDAKTSIGRGHMYYPFSEWGLSSISQSEFWSARGGFSDGYFGVLSVDVCTTGDESGKQAGSFWNVIKGDTLALVDEKGVHFQLAQNIWAQITPRISASDKIAEPRCFHIDNTISKWGNNSRYLASMAELDSSRPGRTCVVHADGRVTHNPKYVGKDEISYSLNYDRWVLCGTFMATHTRMTTMEAANESARHAVRTILKTLNRADAKEPESGAIEGAEIEIDNLYNATYNGASERRVYDDPDTWNLEDLELEDLEVFKRVDRRLNELGLPHFMDIIDFDRKLEHALEGFELYAEEKPLSAVFGSIVASLDAALVTEFGRGYEGELKSRLTKGLNDATAMKAGLPSPVFDDMKGMLTQLQKLLTIVVA